MKRLLILIAFCSINFVTVAQKKSKDVWRLVQVRDGAKLYPNTNNKTEFKISIKEKSFSGYVGCNRFHGKLEYVKGDNISPIKLVSTKMACPDNLDSLEYATMEAISLSDKLVINGSKAQFYNQTRLMLELERR